METHQQTYTIETPLSDILCLPNKLFEEKYDLHYLLYKFYKLPLYDYVSKITFNFKENFKTIINNKAIQFKQIDNHKFKNKKLNLTLEYSNHKLFYNIINTNDYSKEHLKHQLKIYKKFIKKMNKIIDIISEKYNKIDKKTIIFKDKHSVITKDFKPNCTTSLINVNDYSLNKKIELNDLINIFDKLIRSYKNYFKLILKIINTSKKQTPNFQNTISVLDLKDLNDNNLKPIININADKELFRSMFISLKKISNDRYEFVFKKSDLEEDKITDQELDDIMKLNKS